MSTFNRCPIQLQSLPCQFAEAQRSGYSWVKVLPLTYGRARTPWLETGWDPLALIWEQSLKVIPAPELPARIGGGPCRSTPPSAQFWSSHFLVDGSMETTGQLTIPIQLSESVSRAFHLINNFLAFSFFIFNSRILVLREILLLSPGYLTWGILSYTLSCSIFSWSYSSLHIWFSMPCPSLILCLIDILKLDL